MGSQHQDGDGRAMLFEGCNLAFDVQHLLRASDELVGKGSFGTTYKAVLEDDTTIVVKRLRTVHILGTEDFEQQMVFVGNTRHENVAPLRAYYYSKDQKLMLYDFYNEGSVSELLHGKGRRSRLIWESRVKIAVGAALGIAHIHAQSAFHGNIKSSNIFVNGQGYGCVSEFGLASLMKKMSLGEKGDVYSFGLLLLELVTGQSPVEESLVDHLRCLEPSQLIFNKLIVDELDMIRYDDEETKIFPCDHDMLIDIYWGGEPQEWRNMLQVAKRCLALLPEERPSMLEVASVLDNTRKNADELKNKIMGSQHQYGDGRTVLFEGCNLAFDVQHLLRASAELVGKGTFGTTYKVVLEDDTTIVVKRLRTVNILGREDFEQQMEFVGNIRHENVAPLRAYYYSKDQKLFLVYDFYNQGSVSELLHGKGRRSTLNWESRVKIAAGSALGIAHIHAQSMFHGNIKSSNIFVNRQGWGCVSEFGLANIIKANSEGEKGDVYSFGLLLLELVTGQSPVEESLVDRLRCLEPSQLIFNKLIVDELDMLGYDEETKIFPCDHDMLIDIYRGGARREWRNTLQVARRCLALLPEERPSMSDVVLMVDNIAIFGAHPLPVEKKPLRNKFLRFGR